MNKPAYFIERFDPEKHDRTSFSSGVDKVDNYFKKTLNKLAKAENIRAYVMVETGAAETVIGFYAINGHSIHYSELPAKYTRTRPSHGMIPATYISMIGVDQSCQSQGHGAVLLADALKKIVVAHQVAATGAVVLLDVLECGNPDLAARRLAYYIGFGFQPLASDPLRLFMPMGTVLQLLDG